MLTIHSYSPAATVVWLKKGWKLFTQQFVLLSLLSIFIHSLLSLIFSLSIARELGIILLLIFLPLSQMLFFNAAFGVHLRGYLLAQDLFQKLKNMHVWLRLFTASVLNVFLLSMVLVLSMSGITFPSMQTLPSLSPEELSVLVDQLLTPANFIIPIICSYLYMILSLWVYPLICWEDYGVLKAFWYSFKISLRNILPLIGLLTIYVLVSISAIYLIQYIFLNFSISLTESLLLLTMNAFIAAVYISLFVAYMEILYGKEK